MLHRYALPHSAGVDDGAKDLAETKKMLEIAYAEGIRCIIATPPPPSAPRKGVGRESP